MTTTPTTVTIARRYAGPPTSGNGGYTSGLLASFASAPADQPITVTLRRPPPLETTLDVISGYDDGVTRLMVGDDLVAEATPGTFASEAVEPVSLDLARAAESAYRGMISHPFEACFVCGTARCDRDGLKLRPGLFEPGRTACVWTPDASLADGAGTVSPVFVWSALDCPGGWTSDLDSRPLVLGRMTATTGGEVVTGSAYVIVAQLLGEERRKTFTASTAYDAAGRVVGRAEHVWIAIDPALFNTTS